MSWVWASGKGYWQRFFTYCSMDYSFRLKRAHNSHQQNIHTHTLSVQRRTENQTHTHTNTGEREERKALRQNFLQYKMLLESLKSIFFFFLCTKYFFLFPVICSIVFSSCCYCCLWMRDIVTARRDIQTLFATKCRYLFVFFFHRRIFGCLATQ